jgi:branched-chain amino acid transport system ATP-binding protein
MESNGQNNNILLKVSNLSTGYGLAQVLWEISLEIKPGEILALIGSNGAGKTTTLKSIVGLIQIWRGDILFQERSLKGLSAPDIVKLGISYVPEGRQLFQGMTVEENLKMGAFHLHYTKSDLKKALEWIFELFPEISKRKHQLAGNLSGGEQQMVAIGRALMSKPILLMIDELSLGLAPIVVDRLLNTIELVNKAQKTTILLVEQDVEAALSYAGRAYVLENGRIVGQGEASKLLKDPKIRSAYLGLS